MGSYHEYETFCVYANTVIGDQWRGGGSNTRNGSDDSKKKLVLLTEMPAEYKDMKCGANGCDIAKAAGERRPR
eukprot:COSAG05_NODE_1388_length_5007_cov_2.253260_1_plen_73_part_00